MANGNLGLGFLFTAKDLASNVVIRLQQNLVSMQAKTAASTFAINDQLSKFASASMLAGTSVGALAGIGGLAKLGGELERLFATSQATTGATNEQRKEMESLSFAIGTRLPIDAAKATESMITLGQAGYSAADAMKLVEPVLTLSALSGGELSPAKAATVMNQLVKVFGVSADEATASVDQLAHAVNAFAIDFKELPLMLGIAARGASLTGQNITQTLAALGAIKNVIPTTERASTAFSVFNERIAKTKVQEQLKKLGVAFSEMTDEGEKFLPMGDTIVNLLEALQGRSQVEVGGILDKLLGTRGQGGGMSIMKQLEQGARVANGEFLRGAALMRFWVKEAAGKTGDAANLLAAKMRNFAGATEMANTAWDNFKKALGLDFGKTVAPSIFGLATSLNFLTNAWRSLPEPMRAAIATMTTFVAIVGAVVGTVTVAQLTMKTLGLTFSGIATIAKSALATFLPIVGAVALAVGAFYALGKALDAVAGGSAGKFLSKVGTISSAVVEMATTGKITGGTAKELYTDLLGGGKMLQTVMEISSLIESVRNFFSEIGTGFMTEVMGPLKPTFDAVLTSFRELKVSLFGTGSKGLDIEGNTERWISFGSAGRAIGRVFAFLTTIVAGVVQWFTNLATGISDGLAPGFRMIGTIVSSILRPALTSISRSFESFKKSLGIASGEATTTTKVMSVLGTIAKAIGWVMGTVLSVSITVFSAALSGVVWVISKVIAVAAELLGKFMDLYHFFADFGVVDAIKLVVNKVKLYILDMVVAVVRGLQQAGAFQERMEIIMAGGELKESRLAALDRRLEKEFQMENANLMRVYNATKEYVEREETLRANLKKQREEERTRIEAETEVRNEVLPNMREMLGLEKGTSPMEVAAAGRAKVAELVALRETPRSRGVGEEELLNKLTESLNKIAGVMGKETVLNVTMDGKALMSVISGRGAEDEGNGMSYGPEGIAY